MKVRPAVPGVGDRPDHLHGRTPPGTPACPGLHTLLPRGPPTLRGTKCSGDAGGAFPCGAAVSIPSEHLDGYSVPRLARLDRGGRGKGGRLGSGSSAPSSASSFRQSLLLGRRRGLWALPAVLRDSQWVFSGSPNTPARQELPAGL